MNDAAPGAHWQAAATPSYRHFRILKPPGLSSSSSGVFEAACAQSLKSVGEVVLALEDEPVVSSIDAAATTSKLFDKAAKRFHGPRLRGC